MIRDLGSFALDLQQVVTRLLANQNLLKLLYYTDKDPLGHADLPPEIIQKEIYNKLLKIVPRLDPTETARSIVAIRISDGIANKANKEFKAFKMMIEVFVPLTQWMIKDANLRPFSIMSEIQIALKNKDISGLGKITGGDFALNFLSDEMSCYEITYWFTDYE